VPDSPIALVVNAGRAPDVGAELLAAFPDAPSFEADNPEELTGATRAAIEAGASTVLVAGGDGSQRAAAEALRGTDVALAVVPAGSVNLLAGILGIDDVSSATDVARSGTRRRLDVGVADGEAFLLHVTTGGDAEAVAATSQSAKARWGMFGFLVNGVRALRRPRQPTRVVVDGRLAYEGRLSAVLVLTTGRRGSPRIALAPEAKLDDGLLHVQVLRVRNLADVARFAWGALRRRPHDRVVHRTTGQEVVVSSAAPFAVQIDGDERPARSELQCRVEPGALVICAPSEEPR
jgi:diacylglycerol kinase family enzyme